MAGILLPVLFVLCCFYFGRRQAVALYLPTGCDLSVSSLKWQDREGRATVNIRTIIENRSPQPWESIRGELSFYRGNQLLYRCHLIAEKPLKPGEEARVSFLLEDPIHVGDLANTPDDEVSYIWSPRDIFPVGDRLLGIAVTAAASLMCLSFFIWLIGSIKDKRNEKREADYAGDSYRYSSSGYSSAYSYGGADRGSSPADFPNTRESSKEPGTASSEGEKNQTRKKNPYASGSASLAGHYSFQKSSYTNQGLSQNAESAGHRMRSAFADVMLENAELSKNAERKLRSAKQSFENASWRMSNYRSGGESQRRNAENSADDMRRAAGQMLEAVAEEKGNASEFASARRSFENASTRMANYRSAGLTENALNAEHEMRSAFSRMIGASATLDKIAERRMNDARRLVENASWRASNYRKQGLNWDAERCEDDMRQHQAEMFKIMAEQKGNGRAIESAYQRYISASRRYASDKGNGRETNALWEQSEMDRAYAEMMRYL